MADNIWQIDPSVQRDRDATSKAILLSELDQNPVDPALNREYQARFGNSAQATQTAQAARNTPVNATGVLPQTPAKQTPQPAAQKPLPSIAEIAAAQLKSQPAQGNFMSADDSALMQMTPQKGAFEAGLAQTIPQTKQAAGALIGLVGSKLGADGIKAYGWEIYNNATRDMEDNQNVNSDVYHALSKDGSLLDFTKYWTGYGLGQAIETGAMALIGAGIGTAAGSAAEPGGGTVVGAAGGFVAGLVEKTAIKTALKQGAEKVFVKEMAAQLEAGVAKDAAKEAATKAATDWAGQQMAEVGRDALVKSGMKSIGSDVGQNAALLAQNFGQETGEIYGNYITQAQQSGKEITPEDENRAFWSALAAAGIETPIEKYGLGRLVHGGSKVGAGITGAVKTVGKETALGMGREVPTEVAQTAIERYGEQKPLTGDDAMHDYANSAAGAAVMGGSGGAMIGGRTAVGGHVMTPAERQAHAAMPSSFEPSAPAPNNQQYPALPAPTVTVDAAGNAMTADNRNADLQRRANGDVVFDTTAIPQQAPLPQQSPPMLGAPVIDVNSQGDAITGADRNAAAQAGIDDRIARQQRMASGDVQDVTPVRSSLDDRVQALNDFMANRPAVQILKNSDPNQYAGFLQAYRIALNPQQDSARRLAALDAIDAYLAQKGYEAPRLQSPTVNVDQNGVAATVDQRNAVLQNEADVAARRPPRGTMYDITPEPRQEPLPQKPQIPQLTSNVMDGELISQRTDDMPMYADTQGNVGTESGMQGLQQSQQAARAYRADLASRTPTALPFNSGDAPGAITRIGQQDGHWMDQFRQQEKQAQRYRDQSGLQKTSLRDRINTTLGGNDESVSDGSVPSRDSVVQRSPANREPANSAASTRTDQAGSRTAVPVQERGKRRGDANPESAALNYVRPGQLDDPAVGVWNNAVANKTSAWNRVKQLRDQVRAGDDSKKVALIQAEGQHAQFVLDEQNAREAVEQAAKKVGQTTYREKIEKAMNSADERATQKTVRQESPKTPDIETMKRDEFAQAKAKVYQDAHPDAPTRVVDGIKDAATAQWNRHHADSEFKASKGEEKEAPAQETGQEIARKMFGNPNPLNTVDGVHAELADEVGHLGDKIKVLHSPVDLPVEDRKKAIKSVSNLKGLQGLFGKKNGQIYLFAENIPKGKAFAALMHEAGVHAGMEGMIGRDGMRRLSSQLKIWAATEKGDAGDLARKARDRIPEDTLPGDRDEELIAYFVEEAVNAGYGVEKKSGPIETWFRKLWDMVRSAVAKLGADPSKLTIDDVVALARGGLERTLNGHDKEVMRFRESGANKIGPIFGNLDGMWLDPRLEITRKEGDFDKGGFAEHGLMGHFALAEDGSRTYGFNIVDANGDILGYLAGDVKDGRVTAVHDIEVDAKSQGIGSRIVAGLTASGPVKVADILDQSEVFWKRHGAEKDWQGNGQANWEESHRSLDREPGSRESQSQEGRRVAGTEGASGISEADRAWLKDHGLKEGEDGGYFGSFVDTLKTQFTQDATREVVGESQRQYSPEQQAFFRNTGRDIDHPTLKAKAKAVWADFGKKMAQGIFDQFAPIKDITKKGYLLARMSKGTAGAFQALMDHGKVFIRDGVYDADQSGGVIERLFKPLAGEGEDFLWWVAANRAERLAAEGRENLFKPQDIAAGKSLDKGTTDFDYTLQHDTHGVKAGTVTRDRTLIYRDAQKVLNEFNKSVLDVAEQSGLIDAESRKIWEHEAYVPFYRMSEDGEFVGARVKSGLLRQKAFDKLKGGTEKLNSDLMSNVMSNWAHLLDASAKNRAAQETLTEAEKLGIARPAHYTEKGAVWYLKNGEQQKYIVEDPYLLTALNGLEYSGLKGPMMDALSYFKRALTTGVTVSPFFKVRNLIRDSIQAIGTSGLSYNGFKNLKEGYKATDRKSQSYVSLLASGGIIKFGTMLEGKESERIRRLVAAGVDQSTILNNQSKVKAFYGKFIEPAVHAYQELGDRGEEINRAALYQQLVAQGMDHATAALEARDLMDFSMQGSFSSIRLLTQTVPFLNARLQGLYKIGRTAKQDPRKMGVVLGAVALASIGLMLAYKDDDDWKRREDWDRDNYWWFKVGGMAFRIPKPFEFGAIGSVAERGLEYFISDEMTGQRFADRMLSLLSDNLSMNPIPQAVKPMLDVYANKNSFTGAPIESESMQNVSPDQRYNINTSMLARGVSKAGNAVTGVVGQQFISPVQIDHLIQGYFGWLGSFVVSGADALARPIAGEPSRPAPDYTKMLTGSMVSDTEDGQSRYVTQMYDQTRKLTQAYETWRQMVKLGQTDDASAYFTEHQDDIGEYRIAARVGRQLSAINRQIKQEEQSDDDAAEKRAKILELRGVRDKIARALSKGS